tara:strand:- start:546 stop:905 length:360 start_codon:yes stop_codon:yes gene_type:complete
MDSKYDGHNYEHKSKSKIIGFEFNVLNTITNGTMADIIDGEYLFAGTGSVVNNETNDVVSQEITPMVMLINQGYLDKIARLREYIDGNDTRYAEEFDRQINYFGVNTSAREIATKYRNY